MLLKIGHERLKSFEAYVFDKVGDIKAIYNIKRLNNERHIGKIKVAFIVFEPQSWDKCKPVFELMSSQSDFETQLIIVPSFDNSLSLTKEYGYEKEFFNHLYPGKCLLAFDGEKYINYKDLNIDYVFYQDPYIIHYPSEFNPQVVSKYSRICYIPYGYTIMENFSGLLLQKNRSFFKYMTCFFAGNETELSVMKELLKADKNDVYRLEHLGYPSLEKYLDMPQHDKIETITWTPRWSYDEKYGGSHFLEYKESFIELAKKYSDVKFIFRPHPMLMQSLVQSGLISNEEADAYLIEVENAGIVYDLDSEIDKIIEETDILISDVSSIMMSFFLTNRPLIYCECDLLPNNEFRILENGLYTVNSWEEVESHIDRLMRGIDDKKPSREYIINNIEKTQRGASNKIVEFIKNDLKREEQRW